MTKKRDTLIGLAVVGAGVAIGAGVEELLYRRVLRRPDPEAGEEIGALSGERVSATSFDGTQISAHVYGPADGATTIVFAHGVLESHVIWHYQVKDLLQDGDVRIVAYDARGHGASGPARGPEGSTPFTFYTQSRDLVAVVEQLTTDRVVLVGHSMGGMCIQALWEHGEVKPIRDRVSGIVLVNTAYTADLRGWRGNGTRRERAWERIEDVIQELPVGGRVIDRVRPGTNDFTLLVGRLVYGKNPSLTHIAATVAMYEATPSETIAAAIDLTRFDAHDALPLIDVPTLVIAGPKDVLTPLWLSEEIAAQIPDAELVTFDGCGHISPFERHASVSEHIRKFIGRL